MAKKTARRAPELPLKTATLALAAFLSATAALADEAAVPVDLAWDGPRLIVALRDARALAVVDPETWAEVDRRPLGFRPASVAVDGLTTWVGGLDGQAVMIRGGKTSALPPGLGPTRVLALGDGRAAVASRWDETVRVVDAVGTVAATHRLGFPVGAIVLAPGGRIVAADAFGGGLAEIEPGRVGSERFLSLPGVNLRGLAIGEGRELLVAHMAQSSTTPINQTSIDWGLVISSKVSALRLAEFGARGRGPNVRRLTLDGSGHGAADPSGIAATADGTRVVVAVAGSHQLLWIDRSIGSRANVDLLPLGDSQKIRDVSVGRSPVAVVLNASGTLAITADAMGDTLSVVSMDELKVVATVKLGPGASAGTATQRGEASFRDANLAMDRWMSCASCHAEGHTNGLNFDTAGDGNYGSPKNTPTLLGTAGTAPFAWTGRFARVEEQVAESLANSLVGPGADDSRVVEIAAYLNGLQAPPPKRPADDPSAVRGSAVFDSQGCASCHAPPSYTSPKVRDVGLDDGQGGHRKFNPPSLRGVSRTAPYLHDGRAKTLADVLKTHNPAGVEAVSERDQADLAAFLESL